MNAYSYLCLSCGERASHHLAQCPKCEAWGTLVSRNDAADDASLADHIRGVTITARKRIGDLMPGETVELSKIKIANLDPPLALRATPLADIPRAQGALARLSTGYAEVDRVLGGGIVDGSPILFAGEAGCGKSSVALGIANHVASQPNHDVIYVSGEEMVEKIAHRADRLGVAAKRLAIVHETGLERILQIAERSVPSLLIVDSMQVIRSGTVTSDAGTPHQIRVCIARLADFANQTKTPVLIIGHVTKDGAIAGPETLKHLVDVVLYLEGAEDAASPDVRYLSSSKNRHGSASEIGVLEMTARGVVDAAATSTPTPRAIPAPGSILCPVVIGQRVTLVEIEALVGPEREGKVAGEIHAAGVDRARVARILAILAKHAAIDVTDRSVYVSVAGGLRVTDPCADLAIALAIASSARNTALASNVAAFGELALSGEVRQPVPHFGRRVGEIVRTFGSWEHPASTVLADIVRTYFAQEPCREPSVTEIFGALAERAEHDRAQAAIEMPAPGADPESWPAP